jgi:LmbE family N-acetylglucosaminyl deacetylase
VQVVFDKAANRKAIDLFRRVAPSLVFTHPRLDYMSDHEQTHLLARSAAFAYGAPNASSLPLIPGSGVPWLYYCDPVAGRDPYSGELVTPTTYVDVHEQMNTKLAMLACHASQRDWLRAHHGMDEYLDSTKRFSAERGQQIGVDYAEAFGTMRAFNDATAVARWEVRAGEVIGYSGDSGYSEAPHLHYTVRRTGSMTLLCPTNEPGFSDGGWLFR